MAGGSGACSDHSDRSSHIFREFALRVELFFGFAPNTSETIGAQTQPQLPINSAIEITFSLFAQK